MLLAPPTAVKRIESDAKDIYAITDVAPRRSALPALPMAAG
jgi:hypothetical protein